MQKRVIGDVAPERYADAIETLLTASQEPAQPTGF
jgi:hypothetical protein